MAAGRKPYERAGFANEYAYRKARRQAQEWSDAHSRVEASKYRPSMSPETFRAYHDAFSSQATGVFARKKRSGRERSKHLGPSRYVKKYLVDMTGTYSGSEFDDIYSPLR